MTNIIAIWYDIHINLKKQLFPILFVIMVLYLLLCLIIPISIVFISILYIWIAGIIRELYWSSDYYTSMVVGYDKTMSYLWSYIDRPPKTKAKLRMYIFWLLCMRPAWECRVRRLKRNWRKL